MCRGTAETVPRILFDGLLITDSPITSKADEDPIGMELWVDLRKLDSDLTKIDLDSRMLLASWCR